MADTTLLSLLISFAGGVFGAGVGALNAFVFCGVAALLGSVVSMIPGAQIWTGITWGPFLGPHVGFAGGVAATAYAFRRRILCTGRNVLIPGFGLNRPDVLLVGGLFGIMGYVLNGVISLIPTRGTLPWTNTIALSIVVSGFLARVLFGKTGIMGNLPEGKSRWIRSRDEAWQPWPSHPGVVLLMGFGISCITALSVIHYPGTSGLFFGLAAFSLILFHAGVKIPVILHMALAADWAATVTQRWEWGIFFGVFAAILSELFACLFLLHGDTHIDPPAIALVITFTLISLLSAFNLVLISAVWIIVIFVILCGLYVLLMPSSISKLQSSQSCSA